MLCDHEPELGAVLSMSLKDKTVTAYLYFPIYGEETENAEGVKSKPIIGYEVMDTKGTRYNCRESRDPFVYNLLHLLEHPAWLGNKEDCDSWGVYADFMEDSAEPVRGKDGSSYTGKMTKVTEKAYDGEDANGNPKYKDVEVEIDEPVGFDITEEIAWMRTHQDPTMYEARTKFFDKECKWEVT